jgi:mannose/fructose-specific phosphotransferase system component IIA
MIPALVVCHGSLGEAYLDALEGIFGSFDDLHVLSNAGLSAEALEKAVSAKLDIFDERGLIFTDYFGGSCATACLSAMRTRKGIRLVSGVNLPMLIYYLTHRREMDMSTILPGVIHRGQNAIRELDLPGL